MAAPTAPTTTTIATEALKKSGYSSPTTAQITRAWDYFAQEIKNDIWQLIKDVRTLKSSWVIATTTGLSEYSMPSDMASLDTAKLLEGANSGVCQAGGSTTTVKLAATISATEAWMKGKEIIVYLTATPSTAVVSQCTAFDTSTKVATISPAWSPSPDTTYSYIVVDIKYPLGIDATWSIDKEHYPMSKQRPISISPIGTKGTGNTSDKFITFQTPDKTYGIELRGTVNLMKMDEATDLHGELLYRWRNLWIQGIKARQLEDDDDDRAASEMQKYQFMLSAIASRETYGMGLSELQVTLGDF